MDTTKEKTLSQIASTQSQIDRLNDQLGQLKERLEKEERKPLQFRGLIEVMHYAKENNTSISVRKRCNNDRPVRLTENGMIDLGTRDTFANYLSLAELEEIVWEEVIGD